MADGWDRAGNGMVSLVRSLPDEPTMARIGYGSNGGCAREHAGACGGPPLDGCLAGAREADAFSDRTCGRNCHWLPRPLGL